MPTRTDPVTLTLRRHVTPQDPAIVRRLVTDTGFFSLAEVAVAVELVEQRLATGVASGYEFLLAESRGQVIGYTCFGLIACTRGSYDLYWIAVEKSCQRQGIGRQLLAETERTIRQAAGRQVYIETSGRPIYHSTRCFYHAPGLPAGSGIARLL